eukprot:TRINITY_DN12131_c0_g2_i4.p1 TRINITY_DN12131_c0_g2~~TRINITY_DN12131_c0_g2_i4.p1  ORF type:complete len:284 (+),score=64.02 TRINITY_DN12131_c0_g2_i4:66-917(+)
MCIRDSLKEVACKIKTVELMAKNNIRNAELQENNIKDLAGQFRGVVKDIELYKETLNSKISAFHKISANAKQYYDDNVGEAKKEVAKAIAVVERAMNKYSDLSAEINITNRQLKGKRECAIDMESRMEVKRVRDVERLECSVEELRAQICLLKREQREYVDAKFKVAEKKTVSERKQNCDPPCDKREIMAKKCTLGKTINDASGDFTKKEELSNICIEERKEINLCVNKKEDNELELESSGYHKVVEKNDATIIDARMIHKKQKSNEIAVSYTHLTLPTICSV